MSSGPYGTDLWSVRDWTRIAILDTSSPESASFAVPAPLFANLDRYGLLMVWRYDRLEVVATVELESDRTRDHDPHQFIAFHPVLPILATLDDNGVVIWDVDVDTLLAASGVVTVHYANAKVVVVGDSGVGKSALGLVLTGQVFRPTESTHGRHIWTLASETTPTGDGAMVHRETLLWDLAGQPGYRVFHRQHLDEVSVALVLYDARSETDPFAGVSYWARALDDATRGFLLRSVSLDGWSSVSKRAG